MKYLHYIYTFLFGVAVLLFFGLVYPHHLHYQEQYQLFLFDSNYVWEIVRLPGGVADLLGRFCTQFFLFAWVGAFIIAVLLSLIQLLTLRLVNWGWLYGLSFVPSFLLWIFLLDEHALLGGVWAVLLTQLAVWGLVQLKGWTQRIAIVITLFVLYWIAFGGSHYYRYPTIFPTLLYVAWASAVILPFLVRFCQNHFSFLVPRSSLLISRSSFLVPLSSFIVVSAIMGTIVWKGANFKAEKVMQYDFMACHQQWNRILETVNAEKPNNQIGVTVQNLALAMHGQLVNHLSDYNQNGIAGLLPDVQSDATSPMPTAEAFYQLGMVYVAQRTVFEAQEAILDFQKSGRCYKRLAQTNLIIGSYEVARKYLMALQKTLFYRDWANETLPLLGNEEAIAKHPEYGRLRQCAYKEDLTSGRVSSRSAISSELDGSRLTGDFYFSDHTTPEMLESLYYSNPDNHVALQYLLAYYMLTGDRERFAKLMEEVRSKREDV